MEGYEERKLMRRHMVWLERKIRQVEFLKLHTTFLSHIKTERGVSEHKELI